MAYFHYKARAQDNKIANGLVEAPTADSAVKLLRDKQLLVLEISETRNKIASNTELPFSFQRISFTDIVNFTRQLATMVVAGLQLPDAFAILRTQTKNPIFGAVLLDIEHQIVSGGNLADALAKYPQYFSRIYVALIRAGEASGMLDTVLTRLAETMESQQEFRSKVKGAMIYPIIVVIGMILVVMIMMTVVVPKLLELYRDFGATLPWTTQLLMNISVFFQRFWWLVIISGIAGYIGFNKWRRSVLGEFIIDTMYLKIPILGDLQTKIILTDFTRTLGMLIAAGIHVLDALRILKEVMGNVIFRNAVHEIALQIEKGISLGDSFAQHDVFPPIVSQMMKVGEETGKLDETMGKLSKYFQSESEHTVKGLTTAIEPIIMVVLGVGVGFIVISVITPIYNLTSSIK
jgi:type IV pilus assembly protein PilC